MAAVVATAVGPWREVLQLQPSPDVGPATEGFLKVKVLSCGLAFPAHLFVARWPVSAGIGKYPFNIYFRS